MGPGPIFSGVLLFVTSPETRGDGTVALRVFVRFELAGPRPYAGHARRKWGQAPFSPLAGPASACRTCDLEMGPGPIFSVLLFVTSPETRGDGTVALRVFVRFER
jgi:hypothetical protein